MMNPLTMESSVKVDMSGSPSSPSAAPKKIKAVEFSLPLLFSMVLTSCLGIAGFVMAAWATSQLHKAQDTTMSLTSAILVASPSQIPDGYQMVANIWRGSGSWASRPPMLYYRSDHGVASWNDTIFVFGGLSWNDTATTILNRTVRYDLVFNTTTNMTDMPETRARFAWAVLGNKLYVFGGYDDALQFNAVNTTMIYDFVLNSWTTSKSTMVTTRTDSCADTINGLIYNAGGYDPSGNSLSSIEVYNPTTDAWTLSPVALNISRGDCSALAINNQLYVLGGANFFQPANVDCTVTWWLCYRFEDANERFTPAAGTLEMLAPMPHARGDFGCVQPSPGRILVAGGEYNDTSLDVSRLIAQPWAEEYDVTTDYWTPKAPLPVSRFRFSMANAGGMPYAFGGQPSCPNPDQQTNADCFQNGLRDITGFVDVVYPPAFLLERTS